MAAAPLGLAVLFLGVVSLRRSRFKKELANLLGMEWHGHVPHSQLKGLLEAHKLLSERLHGVHVILDGIDLESGEYADEDIRNMNRLVNTVDQHRQQVVKDIQDLASGKSSSPTGLEKALQIHAGRMRLLEILDDLVAGLAEVHHNRTKEDIEPEFKETQ